MSLESFLTVRKKEGTAKAIQYLDFEINRMVRGHVEKDEPTVKINRLVYKEGNAELWEKGYIKVSTALEEGHITFKEYVTTLTAGIYRQMIKKVKDKSRKKQRKNSN